MPFYHFTAAHLLKKILEEGLTLGTTPALWADRGAKYLEFITGTQWLTINKTFEQDWHPPKSMRTLPYARADYRLTIEIPNAQRSHIFTWDDFYNLHMKRAGYLKLPMYDSPMFCVPGDWRIFVGNIHPLWIKDYVENPCAENLTT